MRHSEVPPGGCDVLFDQIDHSRRKVRMSVNIADGVNSVILRHLRRVEAAGPRVAGAQHLCNTR